MWLVGTIFVSVDLNKLGNTHAREDSQYVNAEGKLIYVF
jgi:hypothetical protein